MTDRGKFEQWLRDHGFAPDGIELDDQGGYAYVHDLWECWQGSRDAALEEAAKLVEELRGNTNYEVAFGLAARRLRELKEQK